MRHDNFIIPRGSFRIRSRGTVPHWEMDHSIYFVTFRLIDALPRTVVAMLREERRRLLARVETSAQRSQVDRAFALRLDYFADQGCGACHMRNPRVAELVSNALRFFDGSRYTLHAYSVMPNHVHVLFGLEYGRDLARVLHSWKWFTGSRANEIVGRSGPFWQDEYFDRLVRDGEDYETTRSYVLNNPAKAGLVDWPWVWPAGG